MKKLTSNRILSITLLVTGSMNDGYAQSQAAADPTQVVATHVASWRGPSGNGSISASSYPVHWSESEHLKWKLALPGRGASTPIFVDGKLFVTAADEQQNLLMCVDAKGNLAWTEKSGEADQAKNKKASGANSSPVSDGKHVFAYFKSGDLIACTLSGKKIWELNLQERYGEDTLWWDLGTSPVLTSDAIVIAVMQSGPSFLVALDKSTGKELWKTERQFNVNDESNQAYTTPVVANFSGQETLLTLGADHLTAHDDAGKQLFSVGGFNPKNERFFRSIASPVVAGDLIVCPYARGATVTAIRLDPSLKKEDRIAWFRDDIGVDVPTPAVDGNRVYVLDDKGQVFCLDAMTGDTVWEQQLPKNRRAFSSSPVFCDGKLYCTREDATTFVIDTKNTVEVIAENRIEGETVATLVFADGQIFLRTFDGLYCFDNSQ